MWMRTFPSECPLFRVEKAVNDDRVSLSCGSARQPCGLALDHVWTGIYCLTLAISKDHLAAIRNLLWIYCRVALHHSMQRSCLNLRQASKP